MISDFLFFLTLTRWAAYLSLRLYNFSAMSGHEIFDACRQGNLPLVQQVISAQPLLVNATDEKGFTPLIISAYYQQAVVVAYLIQNGADLNAQDAAGNTALMGVCFKGYNSVAKLLLEAGADVHLRNTNGASALTFAAIFGHLQIADWLLQQGASLTLPDSRGKTPVDHAVIQANEAMLELFQRYRSTY